MIISAIPAGSGKGFGKVVLGAVLIYLSFQIPGFTEALGAVSSGGKLTAGGYAALTAGTLGVSIGVNLAMTGIAEMLAPDPSVDNDQDESYLFQGTGQTLIEGDPVPVLYGKLRVPGRPISLQVRNERLNYIDYGTIYADSTADATDPRIVNPPGGGGGPPAEETENEQMR